MSNPYTYAPTDMPLGRVYDHASAAMNLASSSATTISTAGTAVKAAGTTAERGTAYGFTVDTDNQIHYDLRPTRQFTAYVKASVDVASGTDDLSVQLVKNGSTVVAEKTVNVTSGTPGEVEFVTPVVLSVADYLELHVVNEDTTENVTLTAAEVAVFG